MNEELKFIPIEEIPPAHARDPYWEAIFEKIPEGKAIIIKDRSDSSIRQALKRLQIEGKFLNLKVQARQETIYVANYGQASGGSKA